MMSHDHIFSPCSGIETTHPDFGGRASDTVMSNTYGLARKVTSVAVRVLDQNGYGTTT